MSLSRRSTLAMGVALVSGAATLSVELSAVRLLAPWFGTSSAVWTNVIGVVLLGLAVGYTLGARLSAGRDVERSLAIVLGLAAAGAAWTPGLSGLIARAFLPEGVALDEAADLFTWGSLATSVALFAPSSILLGCVAPLCAEMVQRATRASSGRSSGRVLCASTLGSLVGTFATTYVAIPHFGLRTTFFVAGGMLAVCAVLVAAGSGPRAAALAGCLALLPASSASDLGQASTPALDPDLCLLASRESQYQSTRVVESGSGADRLRFLQVNECFGSFQSVWQPAPGLFPPGFYYNAFAAPVWWSGAPERWNLCVLGLGGGSTFRVLAGTQPARTQVSCTGVELDPVVVDLAREFLELGVTLPRTRIVAGSDARATLRVLERDFDQIVLDAYANQMEIPAHLASREFLEEVREHLVPGGYACANVGGFAFDDPVVQAIGHTLAAAFERRVLALRVPFSRNFVLFARRSSEPPEPSSPEWIVDSPEVERMLAPARLEGMWRWFEPGAGTILTDDHAPIEALQRASIESATARARGAR